MTKKSQFPVITSYDLYKTFAVVTMLIDHIGSYFLPDDQWWRIIGRMSAPVWIFLIGYARSRDIPVLMIMGALTLGASHFIEGQALPLNILFSFIFVRLMLDRMAAEMLSSFIQLVTITLILLVLLIPTYLVFEYGSLCFLIAMCGYVSRWEERYALIHGYRKILFFVVSYLSYVLASVLFFGFDQIQGAVLALLCAPVFVALYRFKPAEYSALTMRWPTLVGNMFRFCGHYSLEIYILHVMAFLVLRAYGPLLL